MGTCSPCLSFGIRHENPRPTNSTKPGPHQPPRSPVRINAVGSLATGLLLGAISILLAVEMKSLLIGEAADMALVSRLARELEATDGVSHVVRLRTLQMDHMTCWCSPTSRWTSRLR